MFRKIMIGYTFLVSSFILLYIFFMILCKSFIIGINIFNLILSICFGDVISTIIISLIVGYPIILLILIFGWFLKEGLKR